MGLWQGMFDGHVESAPPLPREQLALIPAKRGLVLLASAEDRPIVLLSAADLRAFSLQSSRAGGGTRLLFMKKGSPLAGSCILPARLHSRKG